MEARWSDDTEMGDLVEKSPNENDMQQFAASWTAAQPTVAAFVSAIVPSFHDAEDVLQRTATSLVKQYHKYDPKRPFVGWAIGIAKIEVLRYRQERQRQKTIFNEDVINSLGAAYSDMAPKLGEMKESLDICLKEVGGRARQVLSLRYFRDLSPKQVASELGITPNAVLVALHRARIALRQCMERRFAMQGADE